MSGSSSRIHLLLVESEGTFQKKIQSSLKPGNLSGFEMLTDKDEAPAISIKIGSNLQEALDHLSRSSFDAALLNLYLPDSAGLSTLEAISDIKPDLPIVILANKEEKLLALEAVRQKADDYILREVLSPAVLARAVCSAIERKRIKNERDDLIHEHRAAHERLRNVIERNVDGAVVVDDDGIVRFANSAAIKLFEPESGVLLGEDFGFPIVVGERTEIDILRQGQRAAIAEMRVSGIVWEGETCYLAALRDITERKAFEKALKESEARYHSIISSMAEGLVLHNAEGQIVESNNSALRILGITRDQMVGKTSLDPQWRTIHEDGSPFPGEQHPAMITLQTGEPQMNVIMGVKTADEDTRWIQINSQPIFDEEAPSKLNAVVVSFADITDLKRAEAALRQSEERFRTIYDLSPVMMYSIDETGHIINVNRKWSQETGYNREEAVGRKIDMLVTSEMADRTFNETLPRLWETGHIQDVENRYIRKGGEIIDVIVDGYVVTKPSGERTGLMAVRNVTEQKHAQEVLQESERRYRRIVETTNEGIWVGDAEHRTTFVNNRMAEMLGYTINAMMDKSIFLYMDDEGRQLARQNFHPIKERKYARFDLKLLHRDGSHLWVIWSASPIVDADDNYTGMLAMLTDITERRRSERAIYEAQQTNSAILDSLITQVALLNEQGTIISLNSAWKEFSEKYDDPLLMESQLGTNFLRVFERIDVASILSQKPGAVIDIMSMLSGKSDSFELEYRYHSGSEERWSFIRMKPLVGNERGGIVVSHNDITEAKRAAKSQAEAEALAARIKQYEQELNSFDILSRSSQTPITSGLFDVLPLKEAMPDIFNKLADRYADLLEKTLEEQAYKVQYNIPDGLRYIAQQMGLLKARPRDIIEMHMMVLKEKVGKNSQTKFQAYTREGRIMVLELMGYLASFYRGYSLGTPRQPKPEAVDRRSVEDDKRE